MKQSKVKNVQGSGTYDHPQHGTYFKYEYEMEDGQTIHANHKTQNPIPVGSDVEYIVKGDKNGFVWGSVSRPKPAFGSKRFEADPKKQLIIVAQSSMQKAVDILLSGVVDAGPYATVKDFIDKAEAVTDVLMTKQIELAKKHLDQYNN